MQPDRILGEEIIGRHRQPAAIDHEAVERPTRALAASPPPEPRPACRELLVEMGEEHARQVADILRDQEIMLHEALDATCGRQVGVAHAPAISR